MAILYHLLLAIFLLTDLYKCDELPVNITTCTQFMFRNITDTTGIDTPIIEANPPFSLLLGNKCNNGYFKLQNNTIFLSRNLTQYCATSIECNFQCLQGTSNTTVTLYLNIRREANYTLKFKNKTYEATARELTEETEIADLTKELLLTECNVVSPDQIYSVFRLQEQEPYSGWFHIRNIAYGSVFATSMVDYEQLNGTHTVHLVIQASQRLPNSITYWNATTTLEVDILDVDDSNPSFTSVVYHLNITENNFGLSGSPYKTYPPIHAYDGDRGINEIIIYSIEDETKSNFNINNMSGEISVLQELDADGGRDLYVMIIKASQQSNRFRTATSTLSLSVIDIDDNPPIFSPNNYNCNITEHSAVGQVICRVTATDKDKGQYGQFTYELENGSAVDIDPIYGDIQVKDSQKLDREKESNVFFQVLAKSSDGNKTDKANVTINLIDINDNNPVFNQSSFNLSVRNISIGDYVGKISAFDLDSGDNQNLNYTLGTCLSNIGVCTGDNMKCHFPFQIDPGSGNITVNGCTARCTYSTLVSVCDSSHYFSRFCSTTLLAIRVEDSSTLPFFNRISSVQENPANNSQVSQFPAKGNMSTSLRCSPVYPDSTTTPTSEAAGSTVLIISTVVGSVLAVIVVGVIVHYCLILRRRRAKYNKNTRETADAEMQEMEGQKENYSNIEDVYDKITDLPDDYLTAQDITPTVDESEEREGSYEKLRNADKNASEGYSLLNTLTINECESKAMKHENKEQITSTGETNMHSKEPHDDHTNEDVQQ